MSQPIFVFRRSISDPAVPVLPSAFVRRPCMHDAPPLILPASDLPDAIEFAPDSLAQRWLQHLGESDSAASLPFVRNRLAFYADACPRRCAMALLRAKDRSATPPSPHGLQDDAVHSRASLVSRGREGAGSLVEGGGEDINKACSSCRRQAR